MNRLRSAASSGPDMGPKPQALEADTPVEAVVPPGTLAYYYIDISTKQLGCQLKLRLDTQRGDPVLMASAGQWPSVDLNNANDMVLAHECAFDAFHAGSSTHILNIPDASAKRSSVPAHGFYPSASPTEITIQAE